MKFGLMIKLDTEILAILPEQASEKIIENIVKFFWQVACQL